MRRLGIGLRRRFGGRALVAVAGLAQVEDIIRKYTLSPRPSARDARTGVFTNNLNELWKGALDEFLYATLRERNPSQAGGV